MRTAPDWGARPHSVPAHKSDPRVLRAAFGRAPWELTAEEFDAVAEPWLDLTRGERMFGLTVSTMRFGMRLRLVVMGGPEHGYLADVEWDDHASFDDARRAFVLDALARGEDVPQHVLTDYPELTAEA
jgi:hypothetical protein